MTMLLVLGSGPAAYREHELRTAAARCDVVLLQDVPASWYNRYVHSCTNIAIHDRPAVLDATRALAERYPIGGVLTYYEPCVELAALVAAELGLAGNSLECTRRCRDKLAMRQAWEHAGVPSPRSWLATSYAAAEAAAQDIGYPVVLKPRALSASVSVVRADHAAQLAACYTVANVADDRYPGFRGTAQGVLVEEYLAGPEVSVESIVIAGQVHIIAITRKQLGFAPYFEEIGHVVAPGEPLAEESAIRTVVLAAHKALDVRWGATHAEVRLTAHGPRMVEIGARLGGDLIPLLVQMATGVDLAAAAVDVAVGRAPQLEPTQSMAAAIRFQYPPYDACVQDVRFTPAVFRLPWLARIASTVMPEQIVRVPPHGFGSRLGYAVVAGANAAECETRLDEVFSLMQVTLKPLESEV